MSGVRHLLNLSDLGAGGLRRVLDHARARKAARRGLPQGAADSDAPLAGHVLAAIFEKPSTRTRLSFDIAMRQLGGETITLSAGDMQLGRGETIGDTARVLSGFVDAVMIRANRHSDVADFASAATVPVLNGLTDVSHPCQIVADLLAVEERLGRNADGTRWAWVGDGNNVCNSIIEAAGLLGFSLTVACPAGYEPDAGFVADAVARGADIRVVREPDEAAAGADVVVTDTWVSMGDTDVAERQAAFARYQVNEALMAKAGADALFLHCLPAHRGEEVTDAVIDGPQSAAWEEAANRVHAQKALLLWSLGRLG
jgi:ornithine carbamoyltransferase